MTVSHPTQLVDEFKKSGEFDRLRRELLKQFQRSDGIPSFKSRIEDIAQQRLSSDHKLQYLPQELVHRELIQEIDRYPVVDRAVADVRLLSDPSFAADIRSSVQRILRENRGQKDQPQTSNGNSAKSVQADTKPKPIDISKLSNQTEFEAPPQPLSNILAEQIPPNQPSSTSRELSLTLATTQGAEKTDTGATEDVVMSDSQHPAAELLAVDTAAGVECVNAATNAKEAQLENTSPNAP